MNPIEETHPSFINSHGVSIDSYGDAKTHVSVIQEYTVDKKVLKEKVIKLMKRLGAYNNTVICDCGIKGRGQYFRDLFDEYEKEVFVELGIQDE